TGAGPGGGAAVRVFSADGGTLHQVVAFNAYEQPFLGVYVAAADLDGDGRAEIVTGAGPGGQPLVRVFKVNGSSVALVNGFLAYDGSFTGGVYVAAASDGNGGGQIVTGPGYGSGPNVRIWRFAGGAVQTSSFDAYDPGFTGGVSVATGDAYLPGTTRP